MIYVKIQWIHNMTDAPVLVYSEISPGHEELRKVEVFVDGSFGFADNSRRSRDTWLGEAEFPPIDEIAKNDEFVPTVISKQEFENAWDTATSEAKPCF